MCGIAGIYQFKGKNDYISLIKEMSSLLKHRGPDQSGLYSSPNNQVFLGHRRLSIIDVSEKGRQPMSDENDEIVFAYNGEAYNFREIKKEIKGKYKFKSTSDTEVLIYAYKEWGIDFIKKINGMFAFLLYDKKNNVLYAARDRMGIKPLYYLKLKDKIVVSSEIKAILKIPEYRKRLNYKAVSSYLSYRYPLGNQTFFEDIFSLEPGYVLKISKNKVEKIKYWDLKLKEQITDKGRKFYMERIKGLFENAVKKRMISDVPLGAYLSGGLDSSAIVSVMAKNSEKPVKTFTIGFKEEGYNEFKYSKKVADMHKTEHHEILVSAKDYIKTMQDLIRYKDAPLGVPNEVPLYLMSKELKKYITVVLSGEGTDEIFSGYGRIFRSPFDYKKMLILSKIPFAKRLPVLRDVYKNLVKRYGKIKFKNQLEHFLNQYTYFPFEEKFSLFSEGMLKKTGKDKWIVDLFKKNFYRFKASYYRRINYVFEKMHLPGLLQRVDNCTMATSVEARVPFVDHELVEFMMNVPVRYKMKWKSVKDFFESLVLNSEQISENNDITKYILREIVKDDLPEEVIERKKKGFPVPLNLWFKKEFIELTKRELLSKNSRIKEIFDQEKLKEWINKGESGDFGQKLWRILNLEYFLRKYF